MNNPKISILISIYNEEKNIDSCFESIRNQFFKDFEIICINDASNDLSLEKLTVWQKFFGQDKFKLINNYRNLGLTKSLNKALFFAKGKYIARIDADDTWSSDKLKKQVDFMEAHQEYGISGCNYTNTFKNNPGVKKVKMLETDEEIKRKIFRRNPFAHSCIIAKIDLIKKVGGYSEKIKYGQDYDLWLRCSLITKFYNIQEFLCFRTVKDGISVKKQNAQMWQSIKTRAKYIRKYGYSWKNYLYLIEPLAVILTPGFIKNLKRRYL